MIRYKKYIPERACLRKTVWTNSPQMSELHEIENIIYDC